MLVHVSVVDWIFPRLVDDGACLLVVDIGGGKNVGDQTLPSAGLDNYTPHLPMLVHINVSYVYRQDASRISYPPIVVSISLFLILSCCSLRFLKTVTLYYYTWPFVCVLHRYGYGYVTHEYSFGYYTTPNTITDGR